MELVAYLLLLIIFLPLFSSLVLVLNSYGKILGSPRRIFSTCNWILLILVILFPVTQVKPDEQTIISILWFDELGINLTLLVDGLSYLLILFSSFIFLLLGVFITHEKPSFLAGILLVQSSLYGLLLSYNVLVFYFFYELMLFPLFFLMYVHGSDQSKQAVYKFLLYTLAGSLAMLISIVYCGYEHAIQFGTYSFEVSDLVKLNLSYEQELFLLLGFFFAFAVKAPIFPFHSWLPSAYSSAPHSVSILMAALLFQAGVYGLFRFAMLLFPEAYIANAEILAVLAVIGIVYAALLAWRQDSVKRLMAYASVSHVGFSILGLSVITIPGLVGGLFQTISHILIAAGLFMLAGFMQFRIKSDRISDFSGLASVAPRFAFFFVAFSLAAISLPLTIGFVGEFMVLQASFDTHPVLTVIAVSGVILGAIYMLGLCQKILFGPKSTTVFEDLNRDEATVLTSILSLVLIIGVYPGVLLSVLEPVVLDQKTMMTSPPSESEEINQSPRSPSNKRPRGITLASLDHDS